mgnify:CR=1 FL=1
MKKIILLIIVCCATAIATAQQTERFTFATSVGTGIDMNELSTNGYRSVSGQDYLFMRKL